MMCRKFCIKFIYIYIKINSQGAVYFLYSTNTYDGVDSSVNGELINSYMESGFHGERGHEGAVLDLYITKHF